MSLCVIAGATTLRLAVAAFTLSWTHSIERTRWEEDWRVVGENLQIVAARVKGSGAGMEPGAEARLVDGWWRWRPHAPPAQSLSLAGSQATPEGWRLCAEQTCLAIGAADGSAFANGASLAACE